MEPVDITAGRLHLRAWQAGDEPVLVEHFSDPVTQRWTSQQVPYGVEQATRFVAQVAPDGWASERALTWAVCDSTTGQVLGLVELRPAAPAGVWDVGYGCLPAARGGGVVPEALATVCRWAFSVLGAVRLEWTAQVGNWPSRRAAEKAGFRVEGLLRRGSLHRLEPVDCWIAGLLPDDPQTDTARLPSYPDRSDGVVVLRRWRTTDAAAVARACQDDEIARWLPVPVPYVLDSAVGFVDGLVPQQWADGSAANVAAVDAGTGEVLGAAGLTLRDGIAEVGYWVAAHARGRGVATRTARLHTGWAFEALGVPRVELLADTRNLPSQRVAVRAGFTCEGVARAVRPAPRSTDRVDMVVFAKLPND